MKIAGLDIGTTGCKLTVFDESGRQLGKAYRDYPVRRAVSGHETDISTMMDNVYEVIGEMAAQYPDIGGIGVTSFGETFVLTNGAGEPLHNAMLYTDPRGAEECRELVEKLGAEHIAAVTGLAPHEMYSISKLMWIKKHEPKVCAAAKRVHLIEDFVVWHLTRRAQIDYSLAARTMAFDIHTLTWSEEIFDAAGIDLSMMSKPVPTGTSAGTVTPAAAQRTGLHKDCVIVSVSHDQVAAAVGAGAFDGSVAVDGAGTVECLTPVYDSIPDIAVMSRGFFSVVPYAVAGKYVAYAFSYTGGALMQWCMETFGKGETNVSMEQAYTRDEPTGLLVLPHFAGAATPYMDTGSKGAILGLTTASTAADIYRACMEGVAYEMRLNYEVLSGSGIRFEKLHATGGGARSKVWMQMKADVLNLPITALKTADAGTVGSAMLTGIAVGRFANLEDAAARMVQEMETYGPREEMHKKYMKIYERYKAVYKAVRPLM
ncbi:MAG: carbohydrate kinase [Oscillospiraceae bacterium]|nr:carbohydrate kinase [Oscillospiraceae bacterium]